MSKITYTASQITAMNNLYTGTNNLVEIPAIAEEMNKTVASVRAKLVQLGVYKKAPTAKATKTGEKVDKLAISNEILELVNLSPDVYAEGLSKATKAPLERILGILKEQLRIILEGEQDLKKQLRNFVEAEQELTKAEERVDLAETALAEAEGKLAELAE